MNRKTTAASSTDRDLQVSGTRRGDELDRLRWALAVDAVGVGAFDWDLRTGKIIWDERLRALYGFEPGQFDGTIERFFERVHPDDVTRLRDVLDACVADCSDYSVEYRVALSLDETRWVTDRGRALPGPDGVAARVVGVAFDNTPERAHDLRLGLALEAMPTGFWSVDHDWRVTAMNREAERILGATRREALGRRLWAVIPDGTSAALRGSLHRAREAAEPVSFEMLNPAPVRGWIEVRAWPTPDGLSVWALDITARRDAREALERAAQRLALLARVSTELADPLDAHAAAVQIPRLVVPALGDWCILSVVEPADGRLHDIGAWHADPTKRALLVRYTGARRAGMPRHSPVSRALRSGKAATFAGSEVLDVLPEGDMRDLLVQLQPATEIVVPMRARGRQLGALTLCYTDGRRPEEGDVEIAQDVADRAALAMDNARLYTQQRQLAESLQRAMLSEPPEPANAEIVVRYVPAAEVANVGGDWYDAFVQPGGDVVVVIGDVVGHDAEAAGAMGQLRAMLRAIASYTDAGPAEMLRGLDASIQTLRMDVMATVTVVRFEQTARDGDDGGTRIRWANAGHLPLLVARGGLEDGVEGCAEFAEGAVDLLLGVSADFPRPEREATLPAGSTVLLYTDGLIERRNADLDDGLTRLRDAANEFAKLPLPEMADQILNQLLDGHPDDDVALVAVRLRD